MMAKSTVDQLPLFNSKLGSATMLALAIAGHKKASAAKTKLFLIISNAPIRFLNRPYWQIKTALSLIVLGFKATLSGVLLFTAQYLFT